MPPRSSNAGFRTCAAAFACVLALLVILNWRTLADPPYWDSLMGAFSQAVWLARHDMDAVRLLTTQATYVDGGPLVYPFSVYPYAIALLYWSGLTPPTVFVIAHLLNLVCAALTLWYVFRLAHSGLPAPLAALVTVFVAVAPVFASLAAQMNMDMPLTACTVASLWHLHERRYRAASAWAAAGLLIKPTAVILIVANIIVCGLRGFFPGRCEVAPDAPEDAKRARLASAAHTVLFGVFALELVVASTLSKAPAFVEIFGGLSALFGRRVWVIPEYGLALVGFVATLPVIAWRMRRRRLSALELELAVFLLVFVMFFCQYTNPLPRYFLQSYALLVIWHLLLLAHLRVPTQVLGSLLVAGVAFCLVNRSGRFYPSRSADWQVPGDPRAVNGNDGYILERSMEYRDDLRMNLEVVERLKHFDKERTIFVANWPFVHLLAIPELGFTSDAFRVCSPDLPLDLDEHGVAYRELYDTRGGVTTKRVPERILWVLTPNTYSSPQTRLRPELDEIVDVVEVGARRAFIVERVKWQ